LFSDYDDCFKLYQGIPYEKRSAERVQQTIRRVQKGGLLDPAGSDVTEEPVGRPVARTTGLLYRSKRETINLGENRFFSFFLDVF